MSPLFSLFDGSRTNTGAGSSPGPGDAAGEAQVFLWPGVEACGEGLSETPPL